MLQAKLLDALGQIYMRRGHFPEAEALLRDALALRREHLGPHHLDVADSNTTSGGC